MPKQNFNLDSILYPASYVEAARGAFSDYDITFVEGVLTIDDVDPQRIFDEFVNYTIALSNESLP